jgi:hypothetical protein
MRLVGSPTFLTQNFADPLPFPIRIDILCVSIRVEGLAPDTSVGV